MSEPRVLRRPLPLVILSVVVFAECASLVVISAYLIVQLLVSRPDSFASGIALLLLAGLAAVWLGIVGVSTLRGRSWIRGAVATWQVLQIAIGISSFQGVFGRADIGWLLLIPAVIALVLLFTPSVVAATRPTSSESL